MGHKQTTQPHQGGETVWEQLRGGEGAHPVQLLEGFLAALTVPFPPPGHSAGGGSPAWLLVLGFSGEDTGWGKVVTAGALRANCGPAAWSPGHGGGGTKMARAGQARAGLPTVGTTRIREAGEAARKERPLCEYPVLAPS